MTARGRRAAHGRRRLTGRILVAAGRAYVQAEQPRHRPRTASEPSAHRAPRSPARRAGRHPAGLLRHRLMHLSAARSATDTTSDSIPARTAALSASARPRTKPACAPGRTASPGRICLSPAGLLLPAGLQRTEEITRVHADAALRRRAMSSPVSRPSGPVPMTRTRSGSRGTRLERREEHETKQQQHRKSELEETHGRGNGVVKKLEPGQRQKNAGHGKHQEGAEHHVINRGALGQRSVVANGGARDEPDGETEHHGGRAHPQSVPRQLRRRRDEQCTHHREVSGEGNPRSTSRSKSPQPIHEPHQ